MKYKNKDSEKNSGLRKEEEKKDHMAYSLNAKSNIGKMFFKMLKKHFPEANPLSKIFNDTIKISYSCTTNIKSIIWSHNKQK